MINNVARCSSLADKAFALTSYRALEFLGTLFTATKSK